MVAEAAAVGPSLRPAPSALGSLYTCKGWSVATVTARGVEQREIGVERRTEFDQRLEGRARRQRREGRRGGRLWWRWRRRGWWSG